MRGIVDMSPQPRDSANERDALLAWCIDQLGGAIVLQPEDQLRAFDADWMLRAYRDDIGRLTVEARVKTDSDF